MYMYVHRGKQAPIYIDILPSILWAKRLMWSSDDVSLQLRICTRKESKAVRLEAIVDPQVHGPV
jgi:hypothetical protein